MANYKRNVKLTEKDQRIIEFVKNCGICNTSTIHSIFYQGISLRNCQLRLSKLTEGKHLKRFRENVNSQYYYYLGTRPKNYFHKSLFATTIAYMKTNGYDITGYTTPFKIGDIIADGLIEIDNMYYFVEVELSKKLDVEKYKKFYYSRAYKELCSYMPTIILISNKKCPVLPSYIKVTHYKLADIERG